MGTSPCLLGPGLTWVVPAATRRAPAPPGAIVQGRVPFAELVRLEGVWGQVADLQAGELTKKVLEGHPGDQET